MMALSLLAVLTLAKVVALWGRPIPMSGWTPIALSWQDMAIVLALFALESLARRPLVPRIAYALLLALAVANVPVERALGSPVTMQMLRATSGTISDSFAHYMSAGNVAAIAIVLVAGVTVPILLSRRKVAPTKRATLCVVTAALLVVAAGPVAAARVDTAGFDRNELVTLLRSATTRVAPLSHTADWRSSPFDSASSYDRSALIGAAAGRNVLMIVLESTAARYLKSYGAAEDPTPNLTALAKDALLFENAFSTYPESVRGMTALYASRFPAFDVATERHASLMSPSLATVLGANGYSTALFHSGRFMYLGMDTLLARAGFDTLIDAGGVSGVVNSSFGVDELSTVGAMLEWVGDRSRQRPFFVAYMPVAAHHPYSHAASGPWPDDREIDRYRNALHEGDAAIGVLLDGLRVRALEDSTLIVVLADHGEAFGQHPGNYVHTLAIYDENVRVPLFFVIPGAAGASARDARVASLMDVPSTLLDLLGIESPPAFEGTSLLAPRERMALYFTDYSLGLLGLRDRCNSYIYEMETQRSRLFDVCRDPDQRHDIAAHHPRESSAYREILMRWSAAQVARVLEAR